MILQNYNIKYKLNEWYYWIRDFINPRQKWLTKNIPKRWCDKDVIIENCLFDCLVHYVEHEMDIVSWDWSDEVGKGFITQEHADSTKKDEKDILDIYKYITKERKSKQKEIQDLYDSITINPRSPWSSTPEENEKYKRVNSIEEEIFKLDTENLIKIVNLRGTLWS